MRSAFHTTTVQTQFTSTNRMTTESTLNFIAEIHNNELEKHTPTGLGLVFTKNPDTRLMLYLATLSQGCQPCLLSRYSAALTAASDPLLTPNLPVRLCLLIHFLASNSMCRRNFKSKVNMPTVSATTLITDNRNTVQH